MPRHRLTRGGLLLAGRFAASEATHLSLLATLAGLNPLVELPAPVGVERAAELLTPYWGA